MKTYVIMVSTVFGQEHSRSGEETLFEDSVLTGMKIHTIRHNYELWEKRFEKINAGEACLSIRKWEGKAYRSKQVEIKRLAMEDGIGLEKLNVQHDSYYCGLVPITPWALARNDGLSWEDFLEWFRGAEGDKAIIHFTGFRYS